MTPYSAPDLRLKWQADGQQIYPLTQESLSLMDGNTESVKVIHLSLDYEKNISIEDMNITVRAYNCLRKAGYRTASELIGITREELLQIDHLGCSTADDILSELNKIYRDDFWLEVPCSVNDQTSIENITEILKDLVSHCNVSDKQILDELLHEVSDFRSSDFSALFQSKTYRSIISSWALKILEENHYGMPIEVIRELVPHHILPPHCLDSILLALEREGKVMIGDRVALKRMSLKEFGALISAWLNEEEIEERDVREYSRLCRNLGLIPIDAFEADIDRLRLELEKKQAKDQQGLLEEDAAVSDSSLDIENSIETEIASTQPPEESVGQ